MSAKYSILLSSIPLGCPCIKENLMSLLSSSVKVVIIPWAFPFEMSEEEFSKDYFPRFGRRYERSVGYLRQFGIKDENIFIANCYSDSESLIKEKIVSSNLVILPGGNPVMLTEKIMKFKINFYLRDYPDIVMGESAGACIQFRKYFITEENNGPRGFQELEGINTLDVDFLIDVHTNIHTTGENKDNRDKYIYKLKQLTQRYGKDIFAISDDGAIIVNRTNNDFKIFENVESIK